MNVFRIHIRPGGGSATMAATFDYCLKEGILGVGWRVPEIGHASTWKDYYHYASTRFTDRDLSRCKYLYNNVRKGDLAWTRDTSGNYYLARVTSGWEYFTTDQSSRKDIDIGNVFRCDIGKVSLEDVPGKVVACFRPSRAIQRIRGKGVRIYSQFLWNKIAGSSVYDASSGDLSDIFMMLDAEETEDIVFLYLQTRGWYVLPNSRKTDTMAFEYICVNPEDGSMATTQVKTGSTPLSPSQYSNPDHKVFLFQANDIYRGNNVTNVECISRETITAFLEKSAAWLPRVIRYKMELVGLPQGAAQQIATADRHPATRFVGG